MLGWKEITKKFINLNVSSKIFHVNGKLNCIPIVIYDFVSTSHTVYLLLNSIVWICNLQLASTMAILSQLGSFINHKTAI